LKRKKIRHRIWGIKEKYDPLEGAPMARGIVIEKTVREQKQPHSGLIKCVKVQLIKNGKIVVAHVPRNRAINYVNEHDEVIITWLGGSQKGPIGSQWGMRFKVIMVNGVPLELLRTGRAEKKRR
jgi:small subunit ribosomal protein S12